MNTEDRLRQVLADYGLENGGELHSWRCQNPDRFGDCDCVGELTADLVRAIEGDLCRH
jgi:hypothetical protein